MCRHFFCIAPNAHVRKISYLLGGERILKSTFWKVSSQHAAQRAATALVVLGGSSSCASWSIVAYAEGVFRGGGGGSVGEGCPLAWVANKDAG